MHPRTLSLAALAALALSGCIIHVDGTGGGWDGHNRFSYGDYGSGPRIQGNGVDASEPRQVALDGLDGVVVQGGMQVDITVGEAASVEVSGDENVLPHVRVEPDGSLLLVSMERGSYDLDRPLVVTISLPWLSEARVEGSADVTVRGLSGERLAASVLGSGDLTLEGGLEALDLRVEGSGDVDARNVDVRSASIEISGSGDVSLGEVVDLRVEVRGSGDVTYLGRPVTRDVEIRGSGSVRAR